jgi:hypothetical protein
MNKPITTADMFRKLTADFERAMVRVRPEQVTAAARVWGCPELRLDGSCDTPSDCICRKAIQAAMDA